MFLARRLNYFSYELNREVKELYWQTTLYNLAINLTYLFEPIFLYNLGFTLTQIMYFYVLVYGAYAILVFPAAKITSWIGYKHSILVAVIFNIIYLAVLYQTKFHTPLFFVAPFLFALQKSFFWPPYNADIAIHNQKDQRGREVGVLFSLVEVACIIGPIAGGFISYKFGFPALFSAASLLLLASVYPLFRSPEVYTRHEFRFKNFLAVLRHYPQNHFAYWGYAEDLMLMSLWPLFMYFMIPQVFSIGAIVTVASIIAVMVMLYLGRLFDNQKRLMLLPIGSVFYGITWLFRFFAQTTGWIIGFDIATRIGKAMVNVPMLAITYSISGLRGPDYAIAYAVFYEFSLSMGKIFTAIVAILILNANGSIPLIFLVVGILTMFYSFLRK